jgi:BirA family biotin operon repressor/biotin-[acetyl-CoA-carboxylase] ligase
VLARPRVAWRVHYFASVVSTNAVARELADAGEPEGTIVLADEQVGGRGRSGREWFSPKGCGVWASIIVRPSVDARRLAGLGIVTAVAVASALGREFGVAARVKWPNDILAGGRKLGGILVEAGQVAGEAVESAVVGIGLNVDVAPGAFPEELRGSAGSLAAVAGRSIDRLAVLRVTLEAFDVAYGRYTEEGAAPFRESWRTLSMTLGRVVEIEASGRTVTGTVSDLSPEGALILEGADGRTVEIWHGDVRAVRPA